VSKEHLISAFKAVFRSREDVYAEPWQNRKGKKGYSPVCKKKFNANVCPLSYKNKLSGNCWDCANQSFAPIDDEVIWNHITGQRPIGIYPLIPRLTIDDAILKNVCYFAAVDFDDHDGTKDPQRDVSEFYEVCACNDIAVHIERSKSGAGFHAWLFFSEPIPASLARKAVFALLREAEAVSDDDTLQSFDRMFPNQDSLSGKGLGNLIAAPLCKRYANKHGGGMFIDPANELKSFPKQGEFIARIAEQLQKGEGDLIVVKSDLEKIVETFCINEPTATPDFAGLDLPPQDYGINFQNASDQSCKPVRDKCAFIKWCGDNASEVTEPLWRNMISNLVRFQDGPETIHDLSSRDQARYSKSATDSKISHLLSSSGPISCAVIQSDGFTGCPTNGCSVKSPAGLAFKNDPKDVSVIISAIPDGLDPGELAGRLEEVYQSLAGLPAAMRSPFFDKLKTRFKIPIPDSKKTTNHYHKKTREEKYAGGGRDKFQGEVEVDYESKYYYLQIDDEGGITRISSFILKVVERIQIDGQEEIIADIHTTGGKTFKAHPFPKSAWNSKRNFISALPSADLQWTGSDNNVQGVLKRVSEQQAPSKKGTRVIGHFRDGDRDLWVSPGMVISADGPLENDEIVFVDDGNQLPRRLAYRSCGTEEYHDLARLVYQNLPRVNELSVTLPLIGWFFATPTKPLLRQAKLSSRFPLLFVWGTQGSGKTGVLAEVFWPLFGIAGSEPFSATQTDFALLRLLSATVLPPETVPLLKLVIYPLQAG
jgi:hypothetical protein